MLVVTANVCFDRTLWVDELTPGTVSRPRRASVGAGGKGVNVARTLRDLGSPGTLVGLLPADGADRFAALMHAEGLALVSVPATGAVRSATIVLEDDGRATVLNEPGPTLEAADRDRLVAAVATELATGQGAMACSGSLPPGLPVDTYAELVATARGHGVLSVVDTARDALASALPAAPDLVTPNLAEAEGLLTGWVTEPVATAGAEPAQVIDRALGAATRLLGQGARRALVTVGAHGAAFADSSGTHWLSAPVVQPSNPIGAGDSLVGGVLAALGERAADADWLQVVRHGVTVASCAVEHPAAGRVDPARVEALGAAEVSAR